MDVGRGLGAPFKDQAWTTKALLGGVWAVVPFTGFALTGYYMDYIRNTAHGKETPLPEWTLFGRYWVRGLLASIAIFLYMLPAVVLMLVGVLSFVVPASVVSSSGSIESGGMEALFAGGMCLVVVLALVYMVAVWIFAAAAITHYAMHEEFGTAFAFGEIKRRLSTPGSAYATALIMSVVIAIVAGTVSSTVSAVLFVIPIVGWIAGVFVGGAFGFVSSLMAAHLFGQYAARAYGLPGPAGAPAGYAPPRNTFVVPPPAPTPPTYPVAPTPQAPQTVESPAPVEPPAPMESPPVTEAPAAPEPPTAPEAPRVVPAPESDATMVVEDEPADPTPQPDTREGPERY